MTRISKPGWSAFGLAVLVVALDQLSKHWILNILQLPAKGSVPVAGPFNLTMVWNQGVSFGLLRADQDITRWALAAFSIGVAVILAGWARKAERPLLGVALGLVMGGAVGNVIDRIRFGAVADFLDLSQLYFPWIFNVADSAISLGIALLLLDMLRGEKRGSAAGVSRDAA